MFRLSLVGVFGLISSQVLITHRVAHSAEPTPISAERPNVVVFVADDMGWGDSGTYGHPLIRTPNMDRLASEGIKFTQCYSACGVCSPSRSA
ncbi:sulfatase-like hydrolase/transferase, partial [Rhodopirellula sallentina]|uniref:sulfatase-like hydrolase/transferase n=1 Tax=Rhodopirellula sallentina TaxID=1263869 RepID=UPI0005C7D903